MKPDDPTLIDGGIGDESAYYGKYRITGRIGEGGMGVVYCAVDGELGRKVALKFLPEHSGGDAAAEERFLREARAASALDHVHIGTIYGIEEAGDGRRFLVMAYYEGENLAGLMRSAGSPLSAMQAARIAAQIASGLAEAHAHGIIHRDVKPSNILITRQGVVKIVDFGLAQMQGGGQLTQDGARLGTPAYMSPEQALGLPADHRTDLWSLGVVLFEMVTGERPFAAESLPGTLYQVVHAEPRGLAGSRPKFVPCSQDCWPSAPKTVSPRPASCSMSWSGWRRRPPPGPRAGPRPGPAGPSMRRATSAGRQPSPCWRRWRAGASGSGGGAEADRWRRAPESSWRAAPARIWKACRC